jgi:hypothetical protein
VSQTLLRRLRCWSLEQLLLVGFAAAIFPILVLFALQFVALRELDRVPLLSHRASLKHWLDSAGGEVERFYRAAGERLLNVPASSFAEEELELVAEHWNGRAREGVRSLFAVDFRREPTGNFYVYVPEKNKLLPTAASDESLAIVIAALSVGGKNAGLQAIERDPAHRIVLRVIFGDADRVIGVVGFVIDADYGKKKLLPSIIDGTLARTFGEEQRSDLIVHAEDERGATVYGDPEEAMIDQPIRVRFPFVFKDWTLSIASKHMSPDRPPGRTLVAIL